MAVLTSSSFPGRVAESTLEARFDVPACGRMVLRAPMRDLDRPHDRAQFTRRGPVPALREAVEEPGAIGVAAAGRIGERLCRNARNLVALPAGEDERAFRAERDDQRFQVPGEVLEPAAGLFLEQPPFVV